MPDISIKKYSQEDSPLWEKLNIESPYSTFLSSIEWINFQKSLDKEIDQYLIFLENEVVGNFYIEIFRRKFQKFAYSPYGPVLKFSNNSILLESNIKELFIEIKKFMQRYIQEKNLTLFRFDPALPKSFLADFESVGFKSALAPAQAKDTWEINLEASEEELRSNMSKSTRYNLNKTSKLGIEIIKASSDEHIRIFSNLMNETTQRKNFGNYQYEYFRKQFDTLNQIGMMDIYLAKYQDKFLAGALINYYKETAYYTHGCSTSDRQLSKMRAPYFLQWNIMKESKEKGFKKYNMWGILPENSEHKTVNSLKGVSEFKRSFGGYEINYVGPLETFNDAFSYSIHRVIDWWVYKNDRY